MVDASRRRSKTSVAAFGFTRSPVSSRPASWPSSSLSSSTAMGDLEDTVEVDVPAEMIRQEIEGRLEFPLEGNALFFAMGERAKECMAKIVAGEDPMEIGARHSSVRR